MNLRLRGIGVALAALGCSIAFSFPAKAQQPGGDLAPPPPPPDEKDEGEPAGPQAAEEPVPAPDSGPPGRAPSIQVFERDLAPYGRWVDTPEYGRVWIPSHVDSDWRPYRDGRWLATAWGCSFVCGGPWGWAVLYYGRRGL